MRTRPTGANTVTALPFTNQSRKLTTKKKTESLILKKIRLGHPPLLSVLVNMKQVLIQPYDFLLNLYCNFTLNQAHI